MTGQSMGERNAHEIERAREVLWQAALVTLLIAAVAPPLMGFSVDYLSFMPAYVAAAVPAALLPYARRRKMDALRSTLELAVAAPLLAVPIMVATYCAMRFGLPIIDDRLIAADRLLGFDWPAMMRFVDGSPMLEAMLERAYVSFTPQLLLLPMLLSLVRLEARAYRFTLAFLLLGFLAALISIFFPSYGAYVAHGFDGANLKLIDPDYGNEFLESFNGVREPGNFTLSAGNVAGIITFPSVHAGAALLCAWAAWPSRILRYPALIVNGLMLASALTHGGHFLIDLFAGAAVAALCIRLSLTICRKSGPGVDTVTALAEPAAT